ncbi:MAG: LD-carboxypeptidase [Oscillospiraceae bacterium]|nr:LD-carboxypeptidase [Oscillospiraceae bacterium]
MRELVKPQKLNIGDKVAAVSLSWGGAGDDEIRWRYYQGKERLEKLFGLEVVEMPNTLKGSEFIYNNPQKRAEDLMQAFSDSSIKAIITCIGGNDSIRMLPFINFDVIKNNTKIFVGYSDSTVTHYICMKAGITSFYGPSILTDFAENIEMPQYTVEAVHRIFFSNAAIGELQPSPTWTGERLDWIIENKDTARKFIPNRRYELLQGKGKIRGRLIGGCIEVFNFLKGTSVFPTIDCFDDTILFLETAEVLSPPWLIEDELRGYGAMGILNRINGIFWGKPMGEVYYGEYKDVIRKVLREFDCADLPVLYNGSFGHNEPKTILPFGALAEIDCDSISFSILESGVE